MKRRFYLAAPQENPGEKFDSNVWVLHDTPLNVPYYEIEATVIRHEYNYIDQRKRHIFEPCANIIIPKSFRAKGGENG